MHTQNIKSVELSLHDESGGGLTIYASLEKCIKEDKVLTLCIADSDIKYGRTDEFPNEPAKGDTVNKLISTYKRMETNNQPLMCELYCPPINEIENLIPMSVLAKIAEKTDPNIEVGLVFLNKLLSANLVEALLIYDFKKGIKKFKEGPHKSYWQQIGTTINDNSFPLINAKILIHTLNYWEELLSEDSNNINIIEPDSYLENLWNIIGRKVFSWGCANKAIRS